MTVDPAPAVSVIVTTYRTPAEYLRRALRSLVDQSFDDFEVVLVVDGTLGDASEEVVVDVLTDARVRVARPGRIGRAAALNLGLDLARAPLVAIQDADDESHPERLERQLLVLEQRRDLDVLAAGVRRVSGGASTGSWPLPSQLGAVVDVRRDLLLTNPLVHSSVVARRSVLEAVGGYAADRRWQLDHDLYLRVRARGGRLARLEDPLVLKRLHDDQVFEGDQAVVARLWSSFRLQADHARREPAPARFGYLLAAAARFGGRLALQAGAALTAWIRALRRRSRRRATG